MIKGKTILYLGYNGFPVGFAQIERQKLIAKGLIACGAEVTVISRYGFHAADKAGAVASEGTYEGISYRYASGQPFREASFLKRNSLKFRGLFNEMKIIRTARRNKKLDAIIITTNSFYNVFFYSMMAWLYGVPAVLDNVEYWTSIKGSKKLPEKIDNYCYDHFAYRMVDKVIGISDFLVNVVKQGAPAKPVMKVPAIVDFSQFESVDAGTGEDEFLLYCGSAIYYEVLYFVVEAFEQANTANAKLVIVSNGTPSDMDRVKQKIAGSVKCKSIILYSGLPYKKLVTLYTQARALLIPLRNTPQDVARFPHKIGEYCAAGKTIISTNTGEIKNYFTDGQNALLASAYEVAAFAKKMEVAISEPALAAELGMKAYQTGRKNFDHLLLGQKIYEFTFEETAIAANHLITS